MAKQKFKNLAHSADETVKNSVGGKRATAIFDAWADNDGGNVSDIAEAASTDDVEVTEIHVSAYVRGVKETAPNLYKQMPAIAKSDARRGRTAAQPVSESSLLALLKQRKGAAKSEEESEEAA